LEFARPETPSSRIVRRKNGFISLPSIGCFADGYLLVLPQRHVLSFSHLSDKELNVGLKYAEELRGELEPIYGTYILAEHGAGGPCDPGAACVDHAHMHLIPMGDRAAAVREKYLERGGRPTISGGLDSFRAFAETSYVALSITSERYEFWPANRFPRQFVRQVCADLLGLGQFYNWRAHPFVLRMKRTKLLCDAIFENSPEGKVA
jgi:diadenosine tetraphosphate (Ap4A) HIT family hydrolase